jgi:hypothetical protein
VGTRSGDPKDVSRLFLAGLYRQSALDRKEGRPEEAARLVDLLAARFPDDLEVQLLLAESQLEDRKDASRHLAVSVLKGTAAAAAHGLLVDALMARARPMRPRQATRSRVPDSGAVKGGSGDWNAKGDGPRRSALPGAIPLAPPIS